MLSSTQTQPAQAAVDRVVAELTALFGTRVVTSRAVREQHANTTTWVAPEPPDAVVFPRATEEVQQIVERLIIDHEDGAAAQNGGAHLQHPSRKLSESSKPSGASNAPMARLLRQQAMPRRGPISTRESVRK